jgi:hypothetical protein
VLCSNLPFFGPLRCLPRVQIFYGRNFFATLAALPSKQKRG